jgi:hypothetical protein
VWYQRKGKEIWHNEDRRHVKMTLDSSHEKRVVKKSKTQMGAQEKNLKWMLTDEFHKGVAFVED